MAAVVLSDQQDNCDKVHAEPSHDGVARGVMWTPVRNDVQLFVCPRTDSLYSEDTV
jgi:hypothetical protein